MPDGLTSEQQTTLSEAPDTSVRWHPAEWSGSWRDGWERWRVAQQDYATAHSVELYPSVWAKEWCRRRLAMLAGLDDTLLRCRAEECPTPPTSAPRGQRGGRTPGMARRA